MCSIIIIDDHMRAQLCSYWDPASPMLITGALLEIITTTKTTKNASNLRKFDSLEELS